MVYAARCGEALNKAKQFVPHGRWLPWLEENCRVSQPQAFRYMKLAREMPQLVENKTEARFRFESIRSAIAYLTASDEVKEKVDAAPEAPVTEKQIKTWEREYQLALGFLGWQHRTKIDRPVGISAPSGRFAKRMFRAPVVA